MITRKATIASVVIVLSMLFVGFLYYYNVNVVSNRYDTYQDAQGDKLFERGWLPDILPETTKDIRTNNNLDLNYSVGSFTIPVHDLNDFISKINRINDTKFEYFELEDGPKWEFTVNKESGHVSYKLKFNHP